MRKLYLIVFAICIAGTALAQEQINVTVSNLLTFKPVAGVQVVLQNPSIGYRDTATTNAEGQVMFSGLQLNGTYQAMTLENESYAGATSDMIELRSNFTRSVSLSVNSKTTNNLADVVVKARSTSRINTTNAEVGAEMSIKEIRELPVEGRDITRMLYRLPNVSQATGFFPEAANVSINGGNGLFNNYLIDGMDNNEQFLGGIKFPIPVGFTQNVTVLTNNFSAEFGNTENGIINITPKSGTNTTTGEVFFLTRPGGSIDGQTDYAQRDLTGNQVKSGFARYQGGFGLGGAIKKNKTFYYINYEHTTDVKDNLLSSPQLGVNQTVRGINRFDLISAKLDQVWNSHWKSSLRGNVGIVNIDRQAGGLDGGIAFASAANSQDRNSVLVANKNIFTGRNFTSETNLLYSHFRWNYAGAANPNSPDVTLLDPTGTGIAYLGHPGYLFDDHANTEQFQQKIGLTRGKHSFKFGVEVQTTGHQLFGGGNPNGSYTVQLTQAQIDAIKAKNLGADLSPTDVPNVDPSQIKYFGIELRPASFGTRQSIYTAYAEDQYAATSRLNVNVGVRYDYDNLSKGGNDKGDYNNVAPRLSFNYKLNDRMAIRGGYSLVYDKILYTIYSDALQQNNNGADYKTELQYFKDKGILPGSASLESLTYNGNQTVNPTTGVTYLGNTNPSLYEGQRNQFSNERRILNPDGYQNPYTNMFTVGYQYQISKTFSFYADLMYNKSGDLYRTYNYNAPSAWDYVANDGHARSTAAADSSRPLPIYTDATGSYAIIDGNKVYGVAKSVVTTRNDGESKYYALSLNLQKVQGDDKYAFRLIYTLSSLRNNTEDINFRAMDANNIGNDWGPSVNDRRHIINAIVNYYPVKGLTLTAAGLFQSGQPINRVPNGTLYTVVDSKGNVLKDAMGNPLTSNDLNGDGSAFGDAYVGNSDRYPGLGRNTDRLPWSKVIDVSAQYNIKFGHALSRIELRVDVFNVFNTTNLSGYTNNATQSNQIQFGPSGAPIVIKNVGPPRQFQFGVRYAF